MSRFLSDTIHSCAKSEVTEVQLHELDLLFECVLIRDGQAALPCWFPRSDIQSAPRKSFDILALYKSDYYYYYYYY